MCIWVPCASCEHCRLYSALEICSPTATPAWGQGLSDYLSFSSLWPRASHAAGAWYTYAPWRKEGAEKGPGTDSQVWIRVGILCDANGLIRTELDCAPHVKHPIYLHLLPYSRTEEVVTNTTMAGKSRTGEQTDGLERCWLVTWGCCFDCMSGWVLESVFPTSSPRALMLLVHRPRCEGQYQETSEALPEMTFPDLCLPLCQSRAVPLTVAYRQVSQPSAAVNSQCTQFMKGRCVLVQVKSSVPRKGRVEAPSPPQHTFDCHFIYQEYTFQVQKMEFNKQLQRNYPCAATT